MRFLTVLLIVSCTSVFAAEPLRMYDASVREEPSPYAHLNLSTAQLIAAQELELAQFRLVVWWNQEMPLRLRKLDADIAVAQEELASLHRRQAENRRINVWTGGGNPLFQQAEETGVAIVAVQQRLNLLQAERGYALQFQGVEYRQKQMDVERARLNLRLAK